MRFFSCIDASMRRCLLSLKKQKERKKEEHNLISGGPGEGTERRGGASKYLER